MKNRVLVAIGLLCADLGVFVATIAFLPYQGGIHVYTSFLDRLFKSRYRWEMAWTLFIAAVLVSTGVFLLVEGLGVFAAKDEHTSS